jgi:hypothetical protein
MAKINKFASKREYLLTSGNRLHGNRTTWMWAGTGNIILSESREISWQKGEPSQTHGTTQEECLIWVLTMNETRSLHEWNDLSCTDNFFHFICEFQIPTQFL